VSVHSQLDLVGGELPVGVTLTERLAAALAFVTEHQPCSAGQLGAFLHERRGCRWCKPNQPCRYIADEGNQTLRSLRAKGLVAQKRGQGWINPHASKQPARRGGQTNEFPEGF